MAEDMEELSGDEADIEDENNVEEEFTKDGKKKNMSGMIDVISKILNKNVKENEKGVVLSKYKEGKKRKLEKEEETAAKLAKAKIKAEFREKNHVVPDRSNAEREVALRKIGTKGVVKLFNAVTKHQKEVESKLKKAPTEVKKDKVIDSMSKSSFLDMLKASSSGKKTGTDPVKMDNEDRDKKNKTAPAWDILRDDFMMGSKMKDWDKTTDKLSDDEDDAVEPEHLPSSSDGEASE